MREPNGSPKTPTLAELVARGRRAAAETREILDDMALFVDNVRREARAMRGIAPHATQRNVA